MELGQGGLRLALEPLPEVQAPEHLVGERARNAGGERVGGDLALELLGRDRIDADRRGARRGKEQAGRRNERTDPSPELPGKAGHAATTTTWAPHSRARAGLAAQRRYRRAASMSFRRPESSGLMPLL